MTHTDSNAVSLTEELENYIQSVVPAAKTVSKYGGTLFTLKPEETEEQFCGVFTYQKHVQISFSKGAQLADPTNILSGSGKLRRHINFTEFSEAREQALEELLIQASTL